MLSNGIWKTPYISLGSFVWKAATLYLEQFFPYNHSFSFKMHSLYREKQFQVLKQQEKSMWKIQNYFTTFQATLCENRIASVMFLQFKYQILNAAVLFEDLFFNIVSLHHSKVSPQSCNVSFLRSPQLSLWAQTSTYYCSKRLRTQLLIEMAQEPSIP